MDGEQQLGNNTQHINAHDGHQAHANISVKVIPPKFQTFCRIDGRKCEIPQKPDDCAYTGNGVKPQVCGAQKQKNMFLQTQKTLKRCNK